MKTKIMPARIAKPASAYVHGLLTEAPAKLLTLSGQLGMRPDGVCESGAAAQAAGARVNVQAILDEGGMGLQNIIKKNRFRLKVMQAFKKSAKEQKDTEDSIATSEAFIEETTAASEVPAHQHFTRG